MPGLTPSEPRPLKGGWPLYEAPRRFELGSVLGCAHGDLADFAVCQALGRKRAGCWDCNLSDDT